MQEAAVLAMGSGNFVAFSDALEMQLHNIVHVRVGGTMVELWSPEAPEFFLHHNHIDKLWDDWQKKSNAHLNAYSGAFNLNTPMPVAYGSTPGQYNNLKATKVMYVRYSASAAGLGHLLLPACLFLQVSSFTIDLTVLQTSLAKASPSQLAQIPQLAAPILNSAEEKMLTDMTRQSGGSSKQVQDFVDKLATAKTQLTKANEVLRKAGSLRTSFEKAIDKALGFDVLKAVEVLKIPRASSGGATTSGSPATTAGSPTICQRGTVYCAAQKRCLYVTQKCA
jgi:hypothetical protein